MIKFKPGDLVQRTAGSHNRMIPGDIAVVVKHHDAGTGLGLELEKYSHGHTPSNFVLYEENTVVFLNKRGLKKDMEQYKCPYCKSKLDYLRYTAEFIESGYVFGTYDIHGRYNEVVNRDYTHEEENNTEYECPECEEVVTLDDLVLVTKEKDGGEEISEINNELLKKRNIDIVPF